MKGRILAEGWWDETCRMAGAWTLKSGIVLGLLSAVTGISLVGIGVWLSPSVWLSEGGRGAGNSVREGLGPALQQLDEQGRARMVEVGSPSGSPDAPAADLD